MSGTNLSEVAADGPGSQPDLSILIPSYNEVESLPQLLDEITGVLAEGDHSYEVIVVDDGSTDGTWKFLESMNDKDPRILGIRHRRNFGKSAALNAGVIAARGRIVCTMDADLQDNPVEIPAMLARIDDGVDFVTGWKKERHDPLGKRLPSKVFNWFTCKLSGLNLHDFNCGFKMADAEVYRQFPLYGELHRYLPALAHDLGYTVEEIVVAHRAREYGKSKFGIERYIRGGIDLFTVMILTKFGRRPGHFFGGTGAAMGAIGLAILLYLTGVWAFTDQAIGTRPLLFLGVMLVILAAQLLAIGLIAELIINRSPTQTNLVSQRIGLPG